MKTFKILYYNPETDKYIHQTIKAQGYFSLIVFYENCFPNDSKVIFTLNTYNLISIEQVS